MRVSKCITKGIVAFIVAFLVTVSACVIYLYIQWYPVIDKVTSPCKYYPNTFADCRKTNTDKEVVNEH